jgi:hypothetical protein
VDVAVPRNTPDGKTTEWKSRTLRTYQCHTLAANAPIAGCFSPPPHTLARSAPCCWRGRQGHGKPLLAQVKSDWDAWNAGSSAACRKPAIGSSPRDCRRANGAAVVPPGAIEQLHEEFNRRIRTQTALGGFRGDSAVLGFARFRSINLARSMAGKRSPQSSPPD